VRSRQLETALTEFVEEAALHLQSDLQAGAEVPFELLARRSRGRGAPELYCYRPLTDEFIKERWTSLRGLASHARAAAALEGFEGLDRYLLAHDLRAGRAGGAAGRPAKQQARERADAALRALLGDVFAEQSDFDRSKIGQHEERLDGALARLDGSALTSATEVTLLATLHGLTIASPELPLAPGVGIARPDGLSGLPDDIFMASPPAPAPPGSSSSEDGGEDAGHLLAVFTVEDTDALGAIARGREALSELLRALRLFGDGRVTLGRLGWARVGTGAWVPLALPWAGRPHGMLVVTPEQEDELRAFCNLVARRAPRDDVPAWALARFEMGCERTTELQALSDYLLALRALLEPEGPSSGLLAGRLAVLCATPAERVAMTERVVRALALERAAIAGTAQERSGIDTLVRELANNLRALLRDVICSHLDSDLVALADELLVANADPQDKDQALDDDPWDTDQLQLAGSPG
jgi:hypothetical protein